MENKKVENISQKKFLGEHIKVTFFKALIFAVLESIFFLLYNKIFFDDSYKTILNCISIFIIFIVIEKLIPLKNLEEEKPFYFNGIFRYFILFSMAFGIELILFLLIFFFNIHF